ncbi:MAG: hypothetical protein WDW36_010182 [Sanguina aurantia]
MHARSHTRRAAGQQVEVSTCGIPEAPQEMHQKRDVNTGRPPRGGSGGGVDQAQVARHGEAGNIPGGRGRLGPGPRSLLTGVCKSALHSGHGARQHIWTGAQAPQPRRKRCPARGVARGSKGDVTWLPVSGPQAWLWATVCGKASSDLSRHASLAPAYVVSQQERGRRRPRPSVGRETLEGLPGACNCMPASPILPYPVPRPSRPWRWPCASQVARRILVASTHPPLLWRLPAVPGWAATGLGCPGVCEHVVAAKRHTRDMACTPAPTRDGQLGKQVEVSTCGIPEAPQEMHQKRDVNTGRPPRGGSGGGVDPAQHDNRGASAAGPGRCTGQQGGRDVAARLRPSSVAVSDGERHGKQRPEPPCIALLQHTWSRSRNGVAAGPVHRLDGRREGLPGACNACPQAPSFHTHTTPPARRCAGGGPSQLRRILVASTHPPLLWRLPGCPWLGCYRSRLPRSVCGGGPKTRHPHDMACTPAPNTRRAAGRAGGDLRPPRAPQEMHEKRDINTARPPRGGSGGGVDPAQHAHPDTMHAVDSLRTSWLADSATVDDGHKCRQPNKRVRTWECGAMVRGGGHVLTCLGCACARPPRHTMRLTLPREHPGVDDPSTAPGSTSGPVHKHHNRGASAARPGALHGAARGDVTWLPVSGPQAWLWATVCGKASSDLSRHASLAPCIRWSPSRNVIAAGPVQWLDGRGRGRWVHAYAYAHMPHPSIPVPHPAPRPARWRWPVPAAAHPCGVHSSSPAVAAACLSLAGLLPVSAAPECVNMWWRPKDTTPPGHGMHARSQHETGSWASRWRLAASQSTTGDAREAGHQHSPAAKGRKRGRG